MNNWRKGTGWDGQGDDPSEDPKVNTAIESLKKVSAQIKKLKKPTGEQDAPGRTCRQLAATFKADNKELKNGMYFIDPNGGGISDAIEVFCKFDGDKLDKTQTCLVPKVEEYEKKAWFKKPPTTDDAKLFADRFADAQEFTYKTHKSQIKFLKKLSKNGKQKIVVHCRNMIVHDDMNGLSEHAAKLISFDEEEMTSKANTAFRYKVVKDGCQSKNGQWSKTVFEIKAKKSKMARLPILDISLSDVGAGQQFGVEVGRACFSG